MTGFGSAQFDDGTYKIGVEMKAVNNRYRDVSVRMPSVLRPLETDIINVLNKYNLRGKIDIFINFVNNSDNKNSCRSIKIYLPLIITACRKSKRP